VPPHLLGRSGVFSAISLLEEGNELGDGVLLLFSGAGRSSRRRGRAAARARLGNSSGGGRRNGGSLSGSGGACRCRAYRHGACSWCSRSSTGSRLGGSGGSDGSGWGTLNRAEGQELGSSLSSAFDKGRSRSRVAIERSVDAESKTFSSLAVCGREGDGIGRLQ
jgi:hypothetical protein